MRVHFASCAGEVVLFELLAWLQEQEQFWRAEDAPDESCAPELLCEDFNVSTPEATAAQAPCCDEASRAAFSALCTSALQHAMHDSVMLHCVPYFESHHHVWSILSCRCGVSSQAALPSQRRSLSSR